MGGGQAGVGLVGELAGKKAQGVALAVHRVVHGGAQLGAREQAPVEDRRMVARVGDDGVALGDVADRTRDRDRDAAREIDDPAFAGLNLTASVALVR